MEERRERRELRQMKGTSAEIISEQRMPEGAEVGRGAKREQEEAVAQHVGAKRLKAN